MLKSIRNIFTQHLTERNKTYWPHFKWAVYAGVLLFYAAMASVVHAVFPPLFPGTSERIVRDLARRSSESK